MASKTAPAASNQSPMTPMRRLWLRYLKARGAKIGLILIGVFVITAFLAPFIAHRLPYYWQDAATGEISFPLFREFFAPSDTTEPFLEKGLNFLFLFIPLSLLAWRLMNRFLPGLAKMESRAVSLLFGALFSLVLWQSLGGMIQDGGGRDWFYHETRPLPESEDVLNPAILFSPDSGLPSDRHAARKAVVAFLVKDGALSLSPEGNVPTSWRESGDDAIANNLRRAITTQPLIGVEELTSLGEISSRGITDNNIRHGLNLERWNRIVIDYAFPGLLKPFTEFRTAFLVLAVVTFFVLLGMTYIFMTAANQFSISPRWLLLVVLAVVIALPFRAQPRNDYTPYRMNATEGKGVGIFPPLPYGPNEQGFGPRLPPDWAAPSAELSSNDIINIAAFVRALEKPDSSNPAEVELSQLVLKESPHTPLTTVDEYRKMVNQVISQKFLNSDTAFLGIKRDMYILPYFQALNAGQTLSHLDQKRFNRLVVERTLPNVITPALASRWKKPQHQRGSHLLGTDESGRDVLTRLLHGARVSLSVGFVSVALATAIGLVMGSLAAYYGGWIDIAISRFMELMMCFPSFFLILAVIAVLDRRSILNIMLIIGLTSWTGVARLIRGEMLKHKRMDYVKASIALGASDARTIFRHILPNAMAPVLVSISFGITGAILTEASLSFIGFGVTPPTPTWGQLLSETRDSPLANWWLAVFPGMVLFFGVLAYNLVGEALRDALDPRTTL